MADVLETRTDAVGEQIDRERMRLWRLIAETPSLAWLLLSKRPQNYRRLVPPELLALPNVWPGTTVENADYLWRAEELLELQCAGPCWVSHEPMLGPVDFYPVLGPGRIEWLVVGGESGPRWNDLDRTMDLGWLEDVADQCRRAGAALFVKQDNAYKSGDQGRIPDALWRGRSTPAMTRTAPLACRARGRTAEETRTLVASGATATRAHGAGWRRQKTMRSRETPLDAAARYQKYAKLRVTTTGTLVGHRHVAGASGPSARRADPTVLLSGKPGAIQFLAPPRVWLVRL